MRLQCELGFLVCATAISLALDTPCVRGYALCAYAALARSISLTLDTPCVRGYALCAYAALARSISLALDTTRLALFFMRFQKKKIDTPSVTNFF